MTTEVTPICTSGLAGTTEDNSCLIFDYLYFNTDDDSEEMKYGLFCPLEGTISESTSISCLNLFIPVNAG